MLHKEIPFLRIGLPLCIGIISGLYFKPDPAFLFINAFISLSGFAASLFFNKYRANILYGLSLNSAFFLFGILLYQNEKNSLSELKPQQTVFKGTLSDFPQEKEKSVLLTLKLNSMIEEGKACPVNGSILIYNTKDSVVLSMLPGDKILIKCTPLVIKNRGNPFEFDYKFFMENQGIKYYAFTTYHDILSHAAPDHRSLAYSALIMREKIIGMYKNSGITGERLALVAAITLGQKNMLEPEQKQIFIRAGVMHIMAVSGLHVVILSLFVFNLLFFLKGRFNIFRITFTILILWSFAFVTGLTPSVLRATLMFSFIQAGNLMKRKVNGINSVLASAFILIIIRPSVIFDAGFLLSYSAVIFIICFYQELYMKLNTKYWLIDKIWQSAAVTIVAQAGTLSLTILLFNRFPVYFIITNIVLVPLSSVLVIIGCLIPVLYPIHFLSNILGALLSKLTGLTEFLTARASSLPLSNIENIGMTIPECIMMSVAVFLIVQFLVKRKTLSVIFPLSLLSLLVALSTVTDISVRKSNEIIVYNTPGEANIGIRTGKILNVYADTSIINPVIIRHCASQGLSLRTNLLRDRPSYLRVGNETILICSSSHLNTQLKNKAAFVIIRNGNGEKVNNLNLSNVPNFLIFSADISSGIRLPQKLRFSVTDTVHFVRESGAFIKSI